MDLILADLEACAYIDDLVIAHSDWNKHISTLKQVLQRCREKNVSLKLKKCHFTSAKLNYLGYQIGSGQILPQHSKMEAILSYPKPTTRKQLRSFLGLVGYYREHIPNFSKLTAALSDITGSSHPITLVSIRHLRSIKLLRVLTV